MFRCSFCKKTTRPSVSCKMVTIEKRLHYFSDREKANKMYKVIEGRRKKVFVPDPGGKGYQIVREVAGCPDCALRYEREHVNDYKDINAV